MKRTDEGFLETAGPLLLRLLSLAAAAVIAAPLLLVVVAPFLWS